MSPLHVQKKPA